MFKSEDPFDQLPVGTQPEPVPCPHFPDTLHAVVWRNWDVVDAQRLAEALEASPQQINNLAASMGLPAQRAIAPEELRRNYMTIIRRNWHLLPYDQLCHLLGWTAPDMAYALNEDDFMWVKLGGYKPKCPRVVYRSPTETQQRHAEHIRRVVREELGDAPSAPFEPPFGFIKRFESEMKNDADRQKTPGLRLAYPYFLRYGDPLFGPGIDDVPDGYLAALSASGVNAIWFQAVLYKLAPWKLAPGLSHGWEERLANLRKLVDRARHYGIDVYLSLNEPRAMPPSFFDKHPDLRGSSETPSRAPISPDVVALCTSVPAVQDFLVGSVEHVFRSVPNLGGAFTITFSENLTNCYSRQYDKDPCARCAQRGPETVNAEVNELIGRGMHAGNPNAKLIVYAWAWPEEWAEGIIARLPKHASVMRVSEWGTPFTRGDRKGTVNEYSISVVGPSDESRNIWNLARKHGHKTIAKIQAANSWELSSVPYIPAIRLVAEHVTNLVEAGVDGLMMGWTLGGSPSPNLEVAAELLKKPRPTIAEAMRSVARHRFGDAAATEIVRAWNLLSDAFLEFPFDIHIAYNGPQSLGPANLLYARPTGFRATMIGLPFDDLDAWRGTYSAQTLQSQFEQLSAKWQQGVDVLERLRHSHPSPSIEDEWRIAEAAGIHFQSAANQVRFVQARQSDPAVASEVLRAEKSLALRLLDLVSRDSRIGFEATNQYGYTRFDLVEKLLNCRHLLNETSSQSR
jgi:hypothetical protein